ncbi:hypothetical protein DFQ26_007034 [Actinomortierella ambigua]|nr:hypothetical protein DFQ26_007034 [Actinomortierella ambigua]
MSFLSKEWADTIIELPTLTFHTDWLPLSIFTALHGIRIAMAYRQAIEAAAEQSRLDGDENPKPYRVSWGQGLISCLATALGGGFTTSMLLGMPPSWLGSNVVVPTYTLTFFLIQYTSLYGILQTAIPATLLDSILITADASQRGLNIAKLGVDGSRNRFAADRHGPGGSSSSSAMEPWFAMLLLGTISGCGGGLWADVLKLKTHHWSWSTPSWAHAATWDMKAALTSAFFYATSTSPQVYQFLYGNQENNPEIDNTSPHASGGLIDHGEARATTMLLMSSLLVAHRCEQSLAARGYSLVAAPKRWLGQLTASFMQMPKNTQGSFKAATGTAATKMTTTTTKRTTSSRAKRLPLRQRAMKHDDDETEDLLEDDLRTETAEEEEEEEEEEQQEEELELELDQIEKEMRQHQNQRDQDTDDDDYAPRRASMSSARGGRGGRGGRKRGGGKTAAAGAATTATETTATASRTSTRRRKPVQQEL